MIFFDEKALNFDFAKIFKTVVRKNKCFMLFFLNFKLKNPQKHLYNWFHFFCPQIALNFDKMFKIVIVKNVLCFLVF